MQAPTQVHPVLMNKANGLNDQASLVKEAPGQVPFMLNLSAESDVWDRRPGRFFSWLGDGFVTYYGVLGWDDDSNTEVSVIGDTAYDMGTQFSVLLELGVRLIIQSSDGSYWDCTPDATSGLIMPTSVVAPSVSAQTAHQTYWYYQPFGFQGTGGVTRLDAAEQYGGWYLSGYANSMAIEAVQQDIYFSYASGFHLRFIDIVGNVWSLSTSDDGNLLPTII